jgi:hypothetical protein
MDLGISCLDFLIRMPRNNDGSKPERHGQTWKEEEEKFVLEKIKDETAIWKIAEDVKRSPNGVYSHLKEIAVRKMNEGMYIDDASKLTGVSVSDIQEHLSRKELSQKLKSEKGLVQQPLKFPIEKEETLLSVAIEIRDLLKQLVEKK